MAGQTKTMAMNSGFRNTQSNIEVADNKEGAAR